ncbi:unnamed protein product [Polarella glacialis]|uniref:Uncharacterized protein n=2 Tax=Polarella glacialis TaxID=89957 RepID=A0A813E4G9_POLGL|nr:unnamed protein product [Polarella glacialis]CAE8654105.1 unnamed protein product [Polarella glacialis]
MDMTGKGDIFIVTCAFSAMQNKYHRLLNLKASASQQELDAAFECKVLAAVEARRAQSYRGRGSASAPTKQLEELATAYEALSLDCEARVRQRLQGAAVSQSQRRSVVRPAPVRLRGPSSSGLPSRTKPRETCSEGPRMARGQHLAGRGSEGFLQQLFAILKRLSPEQRRMAIHEQLSQSQRLALEEWMLRRPAPRPSGHAQSGSGNGCSRPLGAHIWSCAADGGRLFAGVHLGRGLNAHSAGCRDLPSAATALASLLRWRGKCQQVVRPAACRGSTASSPMAPTLDQEAFACGVLEAFRSEDAVGPSVGRASQQKFFFQARLSFVKGLRLSGPLRSDAAVALSDWRRLGCDSGESLIPGAQLRRNGSPKAAAVRWAETCKAWASMWSERGKSQSDLEQTLAGMEAKWLSACEQASNLMRGAQARAAMQLSRLLARKQLSQAACARTKKAALCKASKARNAQLRKGSRSDVRTASRENSTANRPRLRSSEASKCPGSQCSQRSNSEGGLSPASKRPGTGASSEMATRFPCDASGSGQKLARLAGPPGFTAAADTKATDMQHAVSKSFVMDGLQVVCAGTGSRQQRQ